MLFENAASGVLVHESEYHIASFETGSWLALVYGTVGGCVSTHPMLEKLMLPAHLMPSLRSFTRRVS